MKRVGGTILILLVLPFTMLIGAAYSLLGKLHNWQHERKS